MANILTRPITVSSAALVALAGVLCLIGASAPAQQSSDADDVAISPAEEHYRAGVTFYRAENYAEALDEFNRALALDSEMKEAGTYRVRAETMLDIEAAGGTPGEPPEFTVFDPGSEVIPTDPEGRYLTVEEYKTRQVAEYVERGELYLEHQFYEEAADYFARVLLIAPDNKRAKDGLHKATLGLFEQNIVDKTKELKEQTGEIRAAIDAKKLLPEGATPEGIKPPNLVVPFIEEKEEEEYVLSPIEETLEQVMGVSFGEELHLAEFVDYIISNYDINIMIDSRVVEPQVDPEELDAAGQPVVAPGGFGSAFPGVSGGGFGGGFPGPPGGYGIGGGFGGADFGGFPASPAFGGVGLGGVATAPQIVTDGVIPYVNLQDMKLKNILRAVLKPMNLDYSIIMTYLFCAVFFTRFFCFSSFFFILLTVWCIEILRTIIFIIIITFSL